MSRASLPADLTVAVARAVANAGGTVEDVADLRDSWARAIKRADERADVIRAQTRRGFIHHAPARLKDEALTARPHGARP
jgi:hypothetical protein